MPRAQETNHRQHGPASVSRDVHSRATRSNVPSSTAPAPYIPPKTLEQALEERNRQVALRSQGPKIAPAYHFPPARSHPAITLVRALAAWVYSNPTTPSRIHNVPVDPPSVNSFRVRKQDLAAYTYEHTDFWHKMRNSQDETLYVPLLDNPSYSAVPQIDSLSPHAPIAIAFPPTHGPGTIGVAATELLAGGGLRFEHEFIAARIPERFRLYPGSHGRLIIEVCFIARLALELPLMYPQWPGYASVTAPLNISYNDGSYLSRIRFAQQLAHHLYTFAKNAPNYTYNAADAATDGYTTHAMTLDSRSHDDQNHPRATARIRFEQLRILEAVSFDGRDWYMRVLVVARDGSKKI
ncbi:hypothetical protein C8F01DRAFT_117874 [Mycena amicta]|nr:hypothetical protein C8F01DRAFT_117874 [Mycena amicta]